MPRKRLQRSSNVQRNTLRQLEPQPPNMRVQRTRSSPSYELALRARNGVMNRRRFLKTSLLAAAAPVALPALVRPLLASARGKVLVLGGTSFLGPAVVEAAVVAGHTVTLFNRGITNPGLFPNLEKLRGFRSNETGDQDLSSLANRHFDVVIDVWPNDPIVAATAAEFLKDRCSHYMYV